MSSVKRPQKKPLIYARTAHIREAIKRENTFFRETWHVSRMRQKTQAQCAQLELIADDDYSEKNIFCNNFFCRMNPSRRLAKNKKKGNKSRKKKKTCHSAKEATLKGGEHEARNKQTIALPALITSTRAHAAPGAKQHGACTRRVARKNLFFHCIL